MVSYNSFRKVVSKKNGFYIIEFPYSIKPLVLNQWFYIIKVSSLSFCETKPLVLAIALVVYIESFY